MGEVGYLGLSSCYFIVILETVNGFDWDSGIFMTKKIFPKVKTDEEIEALLENDLSDYLHSGNFQPVTFEFKAKKVNFNY